MAAVGQNNKESLLIPPSELFGTEEEEANYGDVFPVEKKPGSQNRFSYCFGSSDSSSSRSSLSSPVGSELGSTEPESDQDDDYIAELTRQMAHYMLQDDDNTKHEKTRNLDGSLRPTRWPSQEDVQVMDKFENLKRSEDKLGWYQNRESFSPYSILPNARNPNGFAVNFHSKQALIDDQIRAVRQLRKFKQDETVKQKQDPLPWRGQSNKQKEPNTQQVRQVQSKGRACGSGFNSRNGQNISNNVQQQRSSDMMRAAFLGEPGSRSGSCGTGVFLPRPTGNTSESRKKPGCSTVLIPARLVQALRLHFDRVGVPSTSKSATYLLQNDDITGDVSYVLQLQEKSHSRAVPAMSHHQQEISLPQEWTY